jgi:hypothetical protein
MPMRSICYVLVTWLGLPMAAFAQAPLQRVVATYSSRSIAPIAASKVFDFSLQREVNQELGVK